ncbi:MAG: hypothetical protein ACOC8K_09850, partial [Gemmatimonadota bacterium]
MLHGRIESSVSHRRSPPGLETVVGAGSPRGARLPGTEGREAIVGAACVAFVLQGCAAAGPVT